MVKGQLIIQIPVMLCGEDQEPAVLHVVDRVWVPVVNKTGLYTRVRSLPEFLAVTTSGEVTEVKQHELTKCATVCLAVSILALCIGELMRGNHLQ